MYYGEKSSRVRIQKKYKGVFLKKKPEATLLTSEQRPIKGEGAG